MSVPKKRNRLFGSIMLVMMTVLAVYTAAFATEEENLGSYSLVVKKEFDKGLDDKVRAEALKKNTHSTSRAQKLIRTETPSK